jgi:hypothetical protein
MTNNFYPPITTPPELVKQWCREWTDADGDFCRYLDTQAARWGADQELEACCEWLVVDDWKNVSENLRAFRRPKPPSLKEQALEELNLIPINPELGVRVSALDTIRRALEALPDD